MNGDMVRLNTVEPEAREDSEQKWETRNCGLYLQCRHASSSWPKAYAVTDDDNTHWQWPGLDCEPTTAGSRLSLKVALDTFSNAQMCFSSR